MTIFDDAMAAASAAVDSAMSEDWIYQPYAVAAGDVNARKSPDPDRPPQPIVGVFIDAYARAHSGPARHQGVKAERPGHASSRPQLDLDGTQLPYPVRDGDRVTRCKDRKVYLVAEPKFPMAGPRWQLDLNELSKNS
jgi:hypothetical protein